MPDLESDLGTRVHSQVDGTDGRVQIKLVGDASAVLGAPAVNQQMVDPDGNAHVEIHGHKPGGSVDVVMELSEAGAVVPDGMYDASNNTDPGNIGLVGMLRNAVSGNTDSDQVLRITGKVGTIPTGHATEPQTDNTRSLDVSLHDEAGNAYSRRNPLPVSMEESEGTEVHDQNTAAALAALADSTRDYLVLANTTFIVHQVVCDAAGDARYELQIGDGAPVELFTRKAVTYSSNAKRGDIDFSKGLPVVAGGTARTVRLIRKNLDNKPQDVHTTLVGVLI